MPSTRNVATLALLSFLVIGTAGLGNAHETTTVKGYELTFGGADEPVITGERMWMQVEILDAETSEPVEGVADSVGIAVQRPFGNDTVPLDVSGVHGSPGLYEGAVVFTEPGTYTVFVTAEIDGETVETSFRKQVHDASTLQYPTPTPESDAGMDGATGFGLGVGVAAIGMVATFAIGRRL